MYEKSSAAVASAFYYCWTWHYFVPSHVTHTFMSVNGTDFKVGLSIHFVGLASTYTYPVCHPAANGVVDWLLGYFKACLKPCQGPPAALGVLA